MISPVRQLGRWVKRRYFWLGRSLSRNKRIYFNSTLNWRELWHQRTRLASTPRHIQLGTNLTCNLRCVFCRRQHPDEIQRLSRLKPEEKVMSWEIIEKVLPILPFAEIVNITPYGEPLLYPDLERFVNEYKRFGSRNLAITTNGVAISEAQAELLTSGPFQIVFFSIDTSDEAIYRDMRRGGELEQAEAGIERINSWKKRLKTDYPWIVLASTFMRRNIEQLPPLVEFAHRHKVKEISVQLMEIEVPGLEKESLEYYIPLTRQMIKEAEEKAAQLGVPLRIHLALQNLLVTGGEKEEYSAPARLTDMCHYPWYFIYVDTDGDVRPCCWASVCWGNLHRQSFTEIWNGPQAQAMRRYFLRNIVPPYCRHKHCRVDRRV